MQKITIGFILVTLFMLSACSSRTSYAPVKSAYTGKTYHDYRQNSLKSGTYTIQKGETLYSIAFRAGIDFKQLAKANNIKSPYTVYPQQSITIPSLKRNKQLTSTSNKTHYNAGYTPKTSTKTVAKENSKAYGERTTKFNNSATNKSYKMTKIVWRWPTKGKILERFSTKEFGNKGIDIQGSRNQAIYAAAAGKVVYAGSALRGYGKLIIVKHSDKYLSAYAHNESILVKEQQWVESGQHIANMGDSDSNKVKLHFEIRHQGTTVNPEHYLPKR